MRVQLKGINTVRKRRKDGTIVVYRYLRGSRKSGAPLVGEPGSLEFMASYNAALASVLPPRASQLSYIFDEYLDSPEFTGLAASTRKHYRSSINAILGMFGTMPISCLADRRVRRDFLGWRNELAKTTPRQADHHIAVFARVLGWAYHEGLTPAHPLEKPGRLHKGTRRNHVWTHEQEASFYASAPAHLHLPLMMALWTGQRLGDLLKLTWADYDGQKIRLQQNKTAARVGIPVAGPLKAAMDAARTALKLTDAEAHSHPILVNSNGQPWRSGFGASWRKALKEAGLEGVTFRDLRGTAVTRLGRAEATPIEIAAITGHSLKDVHHILYAHYLALDDEMAASAIRKLEAYSSNRSPNSQLRKQQKSGENQ